MFNFGMGAPYAKWLDDIDDASCAKHIVPNMAPGNFHSQVSPCNNLTDAILSLCHTASVLVLAGTRSMFQRRRSCMGIWLCGHSPLAPSLLRRRFDAETPLDSSTRFPGIFKSIFNKRYWLTDCIRISSNKTGRLVRTIWQPAAPRQRTSSLQYHKWILLDPAA